MRDIHFSPFRFASFHSIKSHFHPTHQTPQPTNNIDSMASTSQDPVTLTAECLCKAHIFTTDVSKSQLPIKVSTCHCTSCRHLTGALYSSNAPWPGEREEVVNSGLKVYRFSEKIDVSCFVCLGGLLVD